MSQILSLFIYLFIIHSLFIYGKRCINLNGLKNVNILAYSAIKYPTNIYIYISSVHTVVKTCRQMAPWWPSRGNQTSFWLRSMSVDEWQRCVALQSRWLRCVALESRWLRSLLRMEIKHQSRAALCLVSLSLYREDFILTDNTFTVKI